MKVYPGKTGHVHIERGIGGWWEDAIVWVGWANRAEKPSGLHPAAIIEAKPGDIEVVHPNGRRS